jgi:hypothetical protein
MGCCRELNGDKDSWRSREKGSHTGKKVKKIRVYLIKWTLEKRIKDLTCAMKG